MKSYVIYNASGEILRCGAGVDPLLNDINDPDNEFELLTEWPLDVENYCVENGALVRKPQAILDQEQEEFNRGLFKDQRNALLAASDWTQAADSPLSDAKKAEWATYRQALRDLPANTSDPANPTWPTPPS